MQEQEKFRLAKLEHASDETLQRYRKSTLGHFSDKMRQHMNFHDMESIYISAVSEHHNEMKEIVALQTSVLAELNTTQEEDNLLDQIKNLQQNSLKHLKDSWRSQMPKLMKQAESDRSKRRSQMEAKLDQIHKKFNSDDLLAMQAMLRQF